jgi:hypothetical protein
MQYFKASEAIIICRGLIAQHLALHTLWIIGEKIGQKLIRPERRVADA